MLSSLPPELLDLVVDHLHDEPIALAACCLVSKSWVPRARRHLFARVDFNGRTTTRSIESWMRAFPDPSNSPAHLTRSLLIYGLKSVTAAVTDARTWVHSFCHLVHLDLDTVAPPGTNVSLVQLQRLSPTLKSLHLRYRHTQPSEILDLICSFPLLEDLKVISFGGECNTDKRNTQTSPKFTGSLDLLGKVGSIVRGLLDLPSGPRFTTIKAWCPDHLAGSVMGLVSRCSDTLEYLSINFDLLSRAFYSCSVVAQYLTVTYRSRRYPTSTRPLRDNETQRCEVPNREAKGSMDFRDALIRSTQHRSADWPHRISHLRPN